MYYVYIIPMYIHSNDCFDVSFFLANFSFSPMFEFSLLESWLVDQDPQLDMDPNLKWVPRKLGPHY